MIRTASSIALLGVLACGFAAAAPRPETSTYIDGNVSSLKPNTGGTLVFTDDTSMLFRTGLAEVAVPYASIQKAQLGATQTQHQPTGLKFLAFASGLHKVETQLLIVQFKNGLGDDQTMTLQLAKNSASNVLATIEEHTKVPEKAPASKPVTVAKAETPKVEASKDEATKADSKGGDDWWGDRYWKTNRNLSTWDAQSTK